MVLARKAFRLAREDDEDGLRDFFRRVRIANVPQRGGINEVNVPHGERGKRGLGIFHGVLPQQLDVVRSGHSLINVRRGGFGTDYFQEFAIGV